jgi:hypothetical protein
MVYGTVVVDINAMNESLARLDDTIARLEAATNNNTNSIRQLHIAMNDLQQINHWMRTTDCDTNCNYNYNYKLKIVPRRLGDRDSTSRRKRIWRSIDIDEVKDMHTDAIIEELCTRDGPHKRKHLHEELVHRRVAVTIEECYTTRTVLVKDSIQSIRYFGEDTQVERLYPKDMCTWSDNFLY